MNSGVVIGLAGCSIGTLLGLLSVWNLNPVLQYLGIELFPSDLFDLQTVPYEIDPQWILGIALSAFALSQQERADIHMQGVQKAAARVAERTRIFAGLRDMLDKAEAAIRKLEEARLTADHAQVASDRTAADQAMLED